MALCAGVSRSVMIDAAGLAETVFSGLSALVIEDVEDAGEVIRVRAVSTGGEMRCPGCGARDGARAWVSRADGGGRPGRRVVVTARLRRLRCPVPGCRVQTFREQVPGTLERYQRRTARMAVQLAAVARELAGRASARLLPALGTGASRDTALRALLRIPLPASGPQGAGHRRLRAAPQPGLCDRAHRRRDRPADRRHSRPDRGRRR